MPDANVVQDPKLLPLVNERADIWRSYNDSTNNAKELSGLMGQLAPGASSQLPQPLTLENTPPAELAAGVARLQQQLQEIRQTDAEIQSERAAIARIRHNDQLLLAAFIVVALIAVVLVAHGVGLF